MKKVVRLTESDLIRIVKRVLMEDEQEQKIPTIVKLTISKNPKNSSLQKEPYSYGGDEGAIFPYQEVTSNGKFELYKGCNPGEYTKIPAGCKVTLFLNDGLDYTSSKFECTSDGCKKVSMNPFTPKVNKI